MNSLGFYKKQLQNTKKELSNIDGNSLDRDYLSLKKAFDVSYNNRLFELYEIDPKELDNYKLELFKTLTEISGSLSFLAIQILAANTIMKKNNFHKKDIYFNKKCGIAINHLRANKTIVSATKCENGYLLNGTLTWASGYKIFDTLLIGFHFDGNEYEVMAPFEEQEGFNIGSADDTFVGYGLNTVNIKLDNYFVEDENIVSSHEIGNYTKNKSISKTVHMCLYSLGYCASLSIEDKELKEFSSKRLDEIKNEFMSSNSPKYMDHLRIELFDLVQKVITTAMVVKGGSSILSSSDFQRYYKELIMFNSNGLNQALKDMLKSKLVC
jgi:hypothetical protein